jgi:hypothetical protein
MGEGSNQPTEEVGGWIRATTGTTHRNGEIDRTAVIHSGQTKSTPRKDNGTRTGGAEAKEAATADENQQQYPKTAAIVAKASMLMINFVVAGRFTRPNNYKKKFRHLCSKLVCNSRSGIRTANGPWKPFLKKSEKVSIHFNS